MDTVGQVKNILASGLGASSAAVHSESKASDFPEWDSLRHLELMMDIEHAFKVKFTLEEIAKMDSVEKIVAALQEKVPS